MKQTNTQMLLFVPIRFKRNCEEWRGWRGGCYVL